MASILRTAGLQALATAATTLEIYTTEGGTLLLSFPTTDNVSGSVWTITSSTQNAVASGTPTYAQVTNGSGTVYVSGDVATSGTPFITLGAVTSGQPYSISPSVTLTAV